MPKAREESFDVLLDVGFKSLKKATWWFGE